MNYYWGVLLHILVSVMADVEFEIKNMDSNIIWVGIQGNPGNDHLSNGGFKLGPGETNTLQAPDNWQGRFWARTFCDDNSMHCATGDCGNKLECAGAGGVPPATLFEITLKGEYGLDNYDISLVDGFNTLGSMEPNNGQNDGSEYSCKKAQCGTNINQQCPDELKQNDGDQVVACKSACEALNTDEYCCRGAHDTAETCKSSDWPINYPDMFKKACPDAYSYAYDDHKSLFTCKANKYTIIFGGT